MSIGVQYFQPESFQQANPLLMGIQMGQQFKTNALNNQALQMKNQVMPQSLQAALQQQLLKNAQLGIQNQYLPAQSQANIGLTQAQTNAQNALPGLYGAEGAEAMAKVPLYGAQASLANQQAKMYPYTIAANLDPVSKMLVGRLLYNQISGAGSSPLGQSNVNTPAPSQPGSVNTMQQNTPPTSTASIGGYSFSPIPQGALSPSGGQPSASAPGTNVNDLYAMQLKNSILGMGKNPTMGSYRSGAGGTYIDPFTNQTVSTDTTQQTTQDQRTITGVQNAQQYLNEGANSLSNFVTPSQKMALHLAQIGNLIGGSSSLPSQYAAGKANITQAAEGIIKTFGLNATSENVNKVIDIMMPKYGEASEAYRARVMQEVNNLAQQQGRATSRLAGGIAVNGAPTSSAASTVRVKSPDGRTGSIPANNLQAALQAGYTQVQ